MIKFKREVEITPAFDRRDTDPKKNYGIHGCDLRMVLTGPAGAVQFVLFTNWHLPHVMEETVKKTVGTTLDEIGIKVRFLPMAADLGYHSLVPMYDGEEEPTNKSCPYLGGRPCYYDGSGLNAERVYEVLLKEGSEGVWKYLEGYYYDTFEEDAEIGVL
jgi:hypothetical protein